MSNWKAETKQPRAHMILLARKRILASLKRKKRHRVVMFTSMNAFKNMHLNL